MDSRVETPGVKNRMIASKFDNISTEVRMQEAKHEKEVKPFYSTLSPPEKIPSLYKNLSMSQILMQQRKFAQMGKLIMESQVNPRFKEQIDLDSYKNKEFLASDVIEKFRQEDAKCKYSNTFKYKRKSYEDSVILNSTPAAYCPNTNNSHTILMPTMKYKNIQDRHDKKPRMSTTRNLSSAASSKFL